MKKLNFTRASVTELLKLSLRAPKHDQQFEMMRKLCEDWLAIAAALDEAAGAPRHDILLDRLMELHAALTEGKR